jgi:hypothetical protein
MPEGRLLVSGATRVVPVGAIVYAAIVEPESESSPKDPQSFPWLTPQSSNTAVLRPERVCPSHGASSLAEIVTVFRAVRPGHASLTAEVRRSWRSVPHAPRQYRASVTVQQR